MVGSDSDYLYFVTPSWSDPATTYDLNVCKRTGEITCGCMDAQCRKKRGDILDDTADGCKHMAALHLAYRRLLNQCDS